MAEPLGGAGKIHLPGLGEVDKKYVIAGVAVGGGIAVIVYVRSKKAAASAANQATAQAGTVTDPAGNTCSTVDPNSGYCPGSPEDTAWQQQNGYYSSGGLAALDAAGISSGAAGTSGAGLTTDPSGSQGSVAATGTSAAPGTNSEWLTAALQVLPGGDTSANEAALAGVLGGLTVTTAQKNIFLEAVGLEGQPPGGYPTPIKTSDSAAHPGTPAKTAGAISGLTVSPSGTGMQAKWNAAANATGGYAWKLTGPQNESGNTKSTVVTVHNLKKGTYNFGIQALPGGAGNNGHVTVG